MIKVKCNVCSNENNGFCTIKKVKVHINKKRKCNKYIYDPTKLKIKRKTPLTQIGYVDHQENRRRAKEKLKELKKMVKDNPGNNLAHDLGLSNSNAKCTISVPNNSDTKYPTTGDLSRFTTTAAKKD